MAILRFSIAPEYNSVYLASRDIREKINPFTPACISIPRIYWNDGDTHLRLGKPRK
jgi:hypothetical protein